MSINSVSSSIPVNNVKINAINSKNIATKAINFKGEDTVELSTKKEAPVKKEASSAKKWGVGIASFFVPGLGQAINGEWGKAAGFLFGSIGVGMLGGMAIATGAPLALPLAILGNLGMTIWRTADAVKSAKAE